MRGGLERWKRGVESRGVRHAISYAFDGTCDAHMPYPTGAEALEAYGAASDSTVSRFIVENGVVTTDQLTAGAFVSGSPGTTRSPERSEAISG